MIRTRLHLAEGRELIENHQTPDDAIAHALDSVLEWYGGTCDVEMPTGTLRLNLTWIAGRPSDV